MEKIKIKTTEEKAPEEKDFLMTKNKEINRRTERPPLNEDYTTQDLSKFIS